MPWPTCICPRKSFCNQLVPNWEQEWLEDVEKVGILHIFLFLNHLQKRHDVAGEVYKQNWKSSPFCRLGRLVDGVFVQDRGCHLDTN